MVKDIDYAYATARIKVMEKHMIGSNRIERMIDAKTPADALKVLYDAGYGNSQVELADICDYEILLKEEISKVYTLLKEISPENEPVDVFLQRNDYHNAKVIIKGEYSGQDYEKILLEPSLIDKKKLIEMIREHEISDMPCIMRNAVEECIDDLNRTGDPQIVDILLDKAMYGQMVEFCRIYKSDFLKRLIAVMIDLANIRMFLRIREMKKNSDYLKKTFIAGGNLDNKRFIKNYDEPVEKTIEEIKYTKYGKVFEEGVSSFIHTNSLSEIERLFDNFMIEHIKKYRYVSVGLEPLVCYLIAKENEIRNIRIIMSGKKGDIPDDVIRRRLRDSYV